MVVPSCVRNLPSSSIPAVILWNEPSSKSLKAASKSVTRGDTSLMQDSMSVMPSALSAPKRTPSITSKTSATVLSLSMASISKKSSHLPHQCPQLSQLASLALHQSLVDQSVHFLPHLSLGLIATQHPVFFLASATSIRRPIPKAALIF